MPTVYWQHWFLAAVMIVTALYHLARPVVAEVWSRPIELDADLMHAAMGSTMALMLLTSLTPQASHLWGSLFTLAALWFVGRAVWASRAKGLSTIGPTVGEALLSAAMVVMLTASPTATAGGSISGGGMAGMAGMAESGGSRESTVSAMVTSRPVIVILLAAILCLTLWTAAGSLIRAGYPGGVAADRTFAPTLTAGCQLAMTTATCYMLVLAL
ncbi:MAG: hypothetical protein QOE71_3062 [Pseudonocardiales bacterium]|nr:hypothetical protein [Pseudonocardiales bacterium]